MCVCVWEGKAYHAKVEGVQQREQPASEVMPLPQCRCHNAVVTLSPTTHGLARLLTREHESGGVSGHHTGHAGQGHAARAGMASWHKKQPKEGEPGERVHEATTDTLQTPHLFASEFSSCFSISAWWVSRCGMGADPAVSRSNTGKVAGARMRRHTL